jgi:type 1 glutamine amidotransferase
VTTHPARINAYLVCGGDFHDFDFARRELLGLCAEHDRIRTRVAGDFSEIDAIAASDLLITYTCNVRPTDAQQAALAAFVGNGGRWFALHGTNSALDFTPTGVASPRCFPGFARVLGSQFIAHPVPIEPYRVTIVDPDHWFTKGIDPFDANDELYLSEYHDRDELMPLLETHWSGTVAGFVENQWTGEQPHLVAYLRPFGKGEVLYLTLGHCRGHYDMQPQVEYYPIIERGSWELPQYMEMLRRGLRWSARLD